MSGSYIFRNTGFKISYLLGISWSSYRYLITKTGGKAKQKNDWYVCCSASTSNLSLRVHCPCTIEHLPNYHFTRICFSHHSDSENKEWRGLTTYLFSHRLVQEYIVLLGLSCTCCQLLCFALPQYSAVSVRQIELGLGPPYDNQCTDRYPCLCSFSDWAAALFHLTRDTVFEREVKMINKTSLSNTQNAALHDMQPEWKPVEWSWEISTF